MKPRYRSAQGSIYQIRLRFVMLHPKNQQTTGKLEIRRNAMFASATKHDVCQVFEMLSVSVAMHVAAASGPAAGPRKKDNTRDTCTYSTQDRSFV